MVNARETDLDVHFLQIEGENAWCLYSRSKERKEKIK